MPKNEFDGAQRILKDYYHQLVRQMAEEIIQRADDFELNLLDRAEGIIGTYSTRLNRLSTVYAHLSRFASDEKTQGPSPLSQDEFRCLSCGGVIRREDQECKLCGWTWKWP